MREGGLAQNQVVPSRCLNCGADLAGQFCGACGQRVVPADPTVSELAGDAWQELSGYDGRIASTFRGLVHPGLLTNEYLQGRRARYLSPVRLYFIVSVIYFVISAAAPVAPGQGPGDFRGPGALRIGVWNTNGVLLTEEDRTAMAKDVNDAAWPIRVLLQALLEDPEGFRQRLFTVMPRVFFGMLPVFAGIVWLFYRRRRFPTALVFAVHLHAFAFLAFTIPEVAKFSNSPAVTAIVGLLVVIGFAVYALRAQRAVFSGSWPITIAKAAAIGAVYVCAAIPAFFIILVWASLT